MEEDQKPEEAKEVSTAQDSSNPEVEIPRKEQQREFGAKSDIGFLRKFAKERGKKNIPW